MSTPDILHNIAISQVMVNFAARYGIDTDTCLLATGINAVQLQDSNALVTRDQEMRLIENLILALPDVPALGFELGLQYKLATFGSWGFALRTSRSLHDATQRGLKYLQLSTVYCRISLIQDAQEFQLRADPDAIPAHLRQFLLERDTATAVNLLQELSLSGIAIKRLDYSGPAPPYAARIEELSGIRPCYGRAHNALIMSREDAEIPLPMYDAQLVRMLEDQCRKQLERRQIAGVAGQVRQQLLGRCGLIASLEDVAPALAMAPRSLRRKLEEEGTSFRQILETERQQLAVQLLRNTDMKFDELAYQVGYRDTASFTRAFRRWFEQSPSEYRKAQTS